MSNRVRVCVKCGKAFDGTGEQRMCPECRSAAKAATVMLKRACKACGVVFVGGPRAWYCPDCRAERRKKADRDAKARKAAGTVRKIGSIAYCSLCGKPYAVAGGLQKYCPDCAQAAIAKNIKRSSREWAEKHRDQLAQNKKALNAEKKYLCAYCGKEFVPETRESWCSEVCRKELYRISNASSKYKAGVLANPPKKERYHSGLPQSDLPGVHFLRRQKRWEVRVNGKYLGCFKTQEEAEKVWSDLFSGKDCRFR